MILKLSSNRTPGVLLCTTIFLYGCSSQDDRERNSVRNTFRFEQHLGIAHMRTDETEGCLAVANASINPGVKITLADQPGEHFVNDTTPIIETATVVEVAQNCDDNRLYTTELSISGPTYYRIRADKEWKGNGYVFAIVSPSGAITTNGRAIEGDLDEDGTKEAFRICSSSEGLHYQVWTGQPFTGQPRWHWYVYLGYDVEPSCTEKEYFGPK